MNASRIPSPAVRAGLLVFAAVSTLLGWHAAGPGPAGASDPAEPFQTRASSRPARFASHGNIPGHARQRMAALRAIDSPEERMRATIVMARSLPIEEIGSWLDGRWFDLTEGFDLAMFDRILMERWQAEDIRGFLEWELRTERSDGVRSLVVWLEEDPAEALAYLRESRNDPLVFGALSGIAATRPGLVFDELRGRFEASSKLRGIEEHYVGEVMAELAKSAPGLLEGALDSLSPALRDAAEVAVIGQKLVSSPAAALRELWERQDGWRIMEIALRRNQDLGGVLMGEMANLPESWRESVALRSNSLVSKDNARDWLGIDLEAAGWTASQASRFHVASLTEIATTHPEEALNEMWNLDLEDDDRRLVIRKIFARSGDDPALSARLISLLGTDGDREIAQRVVDRNAEDARFWNLEDPAEWLTEALANPVAGERNFSLVLRNSDESQQARLASAFHTLPADEKSKAAMALIEAGMNLQNLDRPLLGDAIRHLIEHPESAPSGGRQLRGGHVASTHAVTWLQSDPQAAGDWVRGLPPGEPRTWAQRNFANHLAQHDVDAAEQWVRSLPAEEREDVRDFMRNPGSR